MLQKSDQEPVLTQRNKDTKACASGQNLNVPEPVPGEGTKFRISMREIIIGILVIIVTIGMGAAAIIYKDIIINYAAGYSLVGVLVISLLAGSILSFTAVPLPYWILVFTLPTVLAERWGLLAPISVGLISALGATAGHMPTFFIGYSGRSLSTKISARFNSRIYQRVINWAKKHGWIAVFINSAIINPLHLPMTIAFGTLCYPPWKFFLYSLLGNAVKGLVLAFGGYYGLTSLLKVIGG
jgi:membrane protein DedA with SNARE-associated domain